MNATVPTNRLYWSIIDGPSGGIRAGRIPVGLWPMVEEELPVAAEQLWAVGAPIDASRIAVCAIRRADLVDLATETVSLTPESVPDFIPAPPTVFNFLVNDYEPAVIRRVRLRRHLAAAACTMLAVSMVAVGLVRRAGVWNTEAFAAHSATSEVVRSIAPESNWARDDLALELMQRRGAPADVSLPVDAAQALASVITRWPTHVPSKPQTISASGSSASISVTVPGDAQSFLAALNAPVGWVLDEPRLAAIDKGTRVTLELRKDGGEGVR